MNVVRVNSFFRDGLEDYKNSKIVICCGLDDAQNVSQGEWPGVVIHDNSKTPFLLRVDDQSVVWYEDDNFYTTTFGQREIRPAQLFTVDDKWVFEINSSYQYVNPDEPNTGSQIKRIVKVTAVCIDVHRPTKNAFVLWCGLDDHGDVVDGDWMGYCDDDGIVLPVVVSVGNYSEVNYGEYGKRPTNFRSGKIGDCFTIKSGAEDEVRDTYKYEIKEQLVF